MPPRQARADGTDLGPEETQAIASALAREAKLRARRTRQGGAAEAAEALERPARRTARSGAGAGSEPPRSRDYEVGYGRPPKAHQFRPGQSGNPKGRPPRSKNLSTVFQETFWRPVPITENGRRRTVPVIEAFLLRLARGALQGEARAIAQVIRLLPEIQAAYATTASATGEGAGAAGLVRVGADGPSNLSLFSAPEDREALRFFADQIAKGDLVLDDLLGDASPPRGGDNQPDPEEGAR